MTVSPLSNHSAIMGTAEILGDKFGIGAGSHIFVYGLGDVAIHMRHDIVPVAINHLDERICGPNVVGA